MPAFPCTNDCSLIGYRECVSDNEYMQCGYFDQDSCLDWSSSFDCPNDVPCVDGQCQWEYADKLNNIEKQLSSISKIISELTEQIKELIK